MLEDDNEIYTTRSSTNPKWPLYLAILATVLGLLFLLFLINQFFGDDETSEAEDLANATPTMFLPTRVNNELGDGGSILLGEEVIDLPVDKPAQLVIGDNSYVIKPEIIPEGGIWSPDIEDESLIKWVDGTIINYVFVMADTEENRDMFSSMKRGDDIVLAASTGRELAFEFRSQTELLVSEEEIFSQSSPGVTVILVDEKESNTRTVIKGDYIVPDAESVFSTSAGTMISDISPDALLLRQVGMMGDLAIVVNGIAQRNEAGKVYIHYLVDFEIQNRGAAPFNTEFLDLTLQDGAGNIYQLNDQISFSGNHAPISGIISSGQTVIATAGYEVPAGLSLDSVGWFAERSDTSEFVEVRAILQDGVSNQGDALDFMVTDLSFGEISSDGNRLSLRGEVFNDGAQTIIIQEEDITLRSDDTEYSMLSKTPPFPWTIAGGESLEFRLEMQRPFDTELAEFRLFDQRFELTIR